MALEGEFLPHRQLQSVVLEKIRTAILEGEFKPGEWLRQKRIAEDLGVSQMPVREALKELAAEGLVEHVPYRGVRVIEISPEDVADLYAQRACLEARAAYAAATIITAEEMEQLHSIQDQMRASLGPDQLAEYRELNRRFHQAVYSASRRGYLVRTLNQIWSTFPSMLWSDFSQTEGQSLPDRDDTDLHEHEAILAALAARDPEQAEAAVRWHIEQASEALIAALANN